jgi:hypothetical protein
VGICGACGSGRFLTVLPLPSLPLPQSVPSQGRHLVAIAQATLGRRATEGRTIVKRGFSPAGFGWHPSIPDFRDLRLEDASVRRLLKGISNARAAADRLPPSADWRELFPAVDDQGPWPTSCAHACASLVRYFQQRAFGQSEAGSRWFLHHTSRRLAGERGQGGADLRTTLKALVRFGLPPEAHFPYQQAGEDDGQLEPYLFSFAREFHSLRYVCLASPGTTGSEILTTVKTLLAVGLPCLFGFPVPSSLAADADIPYRPTYDAVRGGQAVVAVGYDDRRRNASRGALLIRSSWGSAVGEEGYFWLPYDFVRAELATDFWMLLGPTWLRRGDFAFARASV